MKYFQPISNVLLREVFWRLMLTNAYIEIYKPTSSCSALSENPSTRMIYVPHLTSSTPVNLSCVPIMIIFEDLHEKLRKNEFGITSNTT